MPGQGALIGITERHLITYAACPGLPCAVVSIDRDSGEAQTLADEAYAATLGAAPGGRGMLTIETTAGMLEVIQ